VTKNCGILPEMEKLVEKYLKTPTSALKEIKPLWAYGVNIDKLLDISILEKSIFLVSPM
jgi:hypothetical protein